jgi:hypothetical protein
LRVSDTYADARNARQLEKPASAKRLGHRVGIATRSAQFVYALLGADWRAGSYTDAGKQVHHLAIYGVRYVVDEFRQDVTKTRNYPDRPVMPTWLTPAVDSAVGRAAAGGELVGITGQGWWNATSVSELGTVADGLRALGWSVGSIWCQAISGMLRDA